ncbi:Demethylrebeccamycin-D-glucose O-methyltransferase [Planctomycetes bacterium Poly30]|uniref:Demethylrebeccamycin-D-glucose O-methyltransferase n=1 Tax=Saltatorellus ferox TaxID=2528018 RepID=A0A518ET45_9BACT|nr:Demethylrebeccamycin-D-glucose O-methyltransferase [Planctomycetes bacterium Poly30]
MSTIAPTNSPSLASGGSTPALLKVLADSTRLRVLALLGVEELSVGELSRALAMAQSRVSNHLRVLRDHDLLTERRAGTSTFLRSAVASADATSPAARLWAAVAPDLGSIPEHESDRLRLASVLAERHADDRAFFDRMAGDWDKVGALFRTGEARQRAAASLLPAGLTLADLGCGTGYVARSLVGLCDRLICIDRSEGMLQEAESRLRKTAPESARLEFRQGELDALPLETGELDGATAAMVLHHLPELGPALREMRRVLKPGGTLSIIELMPHREAWMHAELGDRHLGLDPTSVQSELVRAGFEDVRVEPLDDRYCPQPSAADAPDSKDPSGASHAGISPPLIALPLYLVRGRNPRL